MYHFLIVFDDKVFSQAYPLFLTYPTAIWMTPHEICKLRIFVWRKVKTYMKQLLIGSILLTDSKTPPYLKASPSLRTLHTLNILNKVLWIEEKNHTPIRFCFRQQSLGYQNIIFLNCNTYIFLMICGDIMNWVNIATLKIVSSKMQINSLTSVIVSLPEIWKLYFFLTFMLRVL